VATFWEVVGWAAAVLLVGAYGLVATRRLDARSAAYHVMNLIGAVTLAAYSIYKSALPQLALNGFWAVIAVVGVALAVLATRGLTNARVEPDPEPGVEPVREA